MMSVHLKTILKPRYVEIYDRADKNSAHLLVDAESAIKAFLADQPDLLTNICFAVVGSVGRNEALEASDLDLIPITLDEQTLASYKPLDSDLRASVATALGVKVSEGADLTKATSVTTLVEPETIGGERDNSSTLTKRILLLTEGRQAAGGFAIGDVRQRLLEAYAKEERTSGRHVLSLCNDIARYYKTLCIEYKSKIDEQDKDWCTRNVKLRHSRKFWYFANIMAIATLAESHPQGDESFRDAVLAAFDQSPVDRLIEALNKRNTLALGRMLESYAMFLEFMAKAENRTALSKVAHANRYEMTLGNPFPAMKYNSDLLHSEMLMVLEELGSSFRSRVMSWFML